MLKIGDLSRLSQVSVKTLRYYGDLGLLKPEWIDRYTGYRYYAPEQLARLNRILALKDLGFSLDQVRRLLNESVTADELRGMLRLRQAELEQGLIAERARLSRVEARLRQIEREGHESVYPVVLKTIAPLKVLAVHGPVTGYGHTGALRQRLLLALEGASRSDAISEPILARYRQPTERRSLEAEVGITLGAPRSKLASHAGELSVRSWQGSSAAAATLHQGDPESIADAYSALLRWASDVGYSPTAPGMETYLRGPIEALEPHAWVTEVRLPVVDHTESLNTLEKERLMNPENVSLPAFTVVGQAYRGKNEHGEIPAMWAQLNTRWGELMALAKTKVAYGVCREMQSDGTFEYLAGVEVAADAPVPEGLARWDVPAQTYAVFPCTLTTIHQAYEQAYRTWLPTSRYRRTSGPDMEVYPETFEPNDPKSQGMFVYIPIER